MSEGVEYEVCWPDLANGEVQLWPGGSDDSELVLRNVHPRQLVDGRLTSQIFEPSAGDDGQRSTAQGLKVTPAEHFADYINLGLESIGVCAVKCLQIENSGLRWVDDSANVEDINHHAFIDFRLKRRKKDQEKANFEDLSQREVKKRARALSRAAQWVHRPGSDVDGGNRQDA